jgi:hypothetical protein
MQVMLLTDQKISASLAKTPAHEARPNFNLLKIAQQRTWCAAAAHVHNGVSGHLE